MFPAMRIVLIRHGQPHIALRPRTGHAGFAGYIEDYEEAGLAPASLPPRELRELARGTGPGFHQRPAAQPPKRRRAGAACRTDRR